MTSRELVRMRDISISFAGTRVLDNVSFDLDSSEIHAIAGENGAGKSTLIKILAGIYQPSDGEVWLDGKQTAVNDVESATNAGIIVIHQELNLVDSLSTVDNIFLGRELKNRWGFPDKLAMRQHADIVLKRLNFQTNPDLPVGQLRIGEKQLVEIAKALIKNARILIMDEPTSALSDAETESLYMLARQLRDQGLGIVLITHRLSEIFLLSDRITVLRDGQKVGTWPTESIESPAALVSLMIGKTFDGVSSINRDTDFQREHPILSVNNLTLRNEGRIVVNDVSFEVARGEVLGLSGLLGAGKTETLESIFGISALDKVEGRLALDGRDIQFSQPYQSVEAGFAMVTEDRKRDGLLLEHSLEANFLLPNLRDLPEYPFYNVTRARKAAIAHCSTYDVRYRDVDQLAGTLSGGNQQKIIIGKWLLRKPKILLLDEPTRGIDTAAKSDIYKLVRAATENGLTVIIASAEIDELMLLCDRILVLCAGCITGTVIRRDFSNDLLCRLAADHL